MTSFHIHISIPGVLTTTPKEFAKSYKNVFFHNNGTPMTADEVRMELLKELELGHRIIPSKGCDHFDWKKGCLGHEKSAETRGEE